MRASKLLPALLAALVLALLPSATQAQNLAQIYQVTPAPGADLEAAIGEHARWRQENGDPWTWQVFQVAQGPNLGDFYIRSGGHSWADLDAYEQGEFAEAAGEHYQSTMGPAVGKTSNWISATDTAHQRLPESMENIRLFQVITWHLKPDKGQEFQEALDAIQEAIEQTDWPVHFTFVSPVSGLSGPQVSLVIFNEDWASFEGPEQSFDEMMGQVHGEGAMEIFQKFSGAFTKEESVVLRLRPDLSVNLGG